jgi:hypothetical protein
VASHIIPVPQADTSNSCLATSILHLHTPELPVKEFPRGHRGQDATPLEASAPSKKGLMSSKKKEWY